MSRPSSITVALFMLPVLPVVTSGCGGNSATNLTAPSTTKCAISAQATTSSFPHAGGTANVVVSATRDCAWSIATEASWIAFASNTEGLGEASVTYSVAPNTQQVERRAAIDVSGTRLSVVQAAAPPPPPPPPPAPNPPPAPVPDPSAPNPPPAPAPDASAPNPRPAPDPPPAPNPPPADEGDAEEEDGASDAGSGSLEVTGPIDALSGACPDLKLTVASTTVVTDRRTNFKQTTCGDLQAGQNVVARGRRQPNGELYASKIERR